MREQLFRRHDKPATAIAALYCSLVNKRLLNRVQATAGRQALDRGDGASLD